MVGTELRGGRYALVRTLGEGSQGETFEAIDKRDGKTVALKRFRVGNAKAWKDVELAEREASTLASLEHELLPRYIEHFEEDGALVLVMERIEGESLAELRKRSFRGSVSDVHRLLGDASRALTYLHGRAPPVVHRDLKPGNVIRRPDGSFAFVDFGAVRDRLKLAGGSTVVGTFGYMAPEQFQGRASAASDVYGIGATALAMLTGCEPEDLPHKGLGIDVASAVPAGTPAPLVRTLEAMLEPDPEKRASSIREAMDRSRDSRGSQAPMTLLARLLLVVVELVTACWRASKRALRRPEPEAPPRVRVPENDLLRSIRAVTPEQAQQEAIRVASQREALDAEDWADHFASEAAAEWEPPDAWREREAAEAAQAAEDKRKGLKRRS
jgi:serine/threonine protein kinase